MRPGEERPADLDLAVRFVIPRVAGRADDAAILPVEREEGAAGVHRPPEELTEDRLGAAIGVRVLLPDERVGRHREQRGKVLLAKRAQFDDVAGQHWLEIKGHLTHGSAKSRVNSQLPSPNSQPLAWESVVG